MNRRNLLTTRDYTRGVNAVWAGAIAAAVAFLLGIAVGAARSKRHRAVAVAEAAGADARVRSTEAELRSMAVALASMQEGVVLFGRDGRSTFANAAVTTHLGAVPSRLEEIVPRELRDAARRASLVHLETGVEAATPDGSRWLAGSATPVGDGDAVLLVIRDVTEPRRIDAVRRDFVANASHELKTPVASIRAVAETLTDAARDDPDAVARFAPTLEREAERLSRIVSDLLDLTRLEAGSSLDDDVDLVDVVREESGRFDDAARVGGLHLTWSLAPRAVVRGSTRDLTLLVRNLNENAIRYTATGGRIDVAVRVDDEEVVVVVADTGAGIPSADLDRVFERFYRVDRARSRETGGTGLGLAIVRHVVENHGGSVDVRSELERGSTFEVRLPGAPTG